MSTRAFKTFTTAIHPVNEHWFQRWFGPHPEVLEYAEDEHRVRAELKQLLAISNQRRLTPKERSLIPTYDAIINANRALSMLNGVDYADYGFTGIDQIHFNSKGFECGCVCHVVFDHHKAQAAEPHEHHAHEPLRVCDDHAHLQHDWNDHHDKVVAANGIRAKDAPKE